MRGPWLIDSHLNGALGVAFDSATREDIARIGLYLARRHRLAAYVATLISQPQTRLLAAIARLRDSTTLPGARILGIHVEGPFLHPAYRGAHPRRALRLPDVREFAEWVRVADGQLRMITIAPELPGATEVIREARRNGVVVSLGHTGATYHEARRAIRAGATHITHVFNAMRPFHHRDAGVLGAALLEDVWVEAVYDGQHIGREAMELLLRCQGKERIVLASDGSPALGAAPGRYEFTGIPIELRGGRSVVRGNGNLAGSALGLWDCYRLFVRDFGEAPQVVTSNPARMLGLGGHLTPHAPR